MFRNSYLDTYKHAVLHNKEVEFLFVHLSQIYSTLGSVINDLEYQFGLILSQTSQAQINPRNISKVSYGNKPPQLTLKTEMKDLQNKLQNFHHLEATKISPKNFELKSLPVQKQPINKSKIQQQQITERRNSKQKYLPIIESTQDFDNLFLNPKQQPINQNSNTRQQARQPSRMKQGSQGNNNKKMSSNKISEDEQADYMDKLFRN